MNVVAVIVTYNRLALLKECIEAVKSQTFRVHELVVINNSSTDGTTEWLNGEQGVTVIHQENTGGAGGFYTGTKYASKQGADWIWLMDDDTICTASCLEKMIEKLPVAGVDKTGFICSKVLWKDGTPHKMNLPDSTLFFNENLPFTTFDEQHLLLTKQCSFVSVLINSHAVKKVGLPYKDFYIWGDDQEYTRRITKAGYLGFYCADSIALHKTPSNHRVYLYTDEAKNLWKYEYGYRNELFMKRKEKGFAYTLPYAAAKVIYGSFNILKKTKHNKPKFLSMLFRSAWQSFFFNPKIEFAD